MDEVEILQMIEGRKTQEHRWFSTMRMLAFFTVIPHSKDKGLKPEDLFTLPGDEVKAKPTREQRKEDRARMMKVFAKWDKAEAAKRNEIN